MGSRTPSTLTALYRTPQLIDQPIYSLAQVSRYVGVPTVTVRSWVVGRDYETAQGRRRWKPLIHPADGAGDFLSFTNLTEVHVLGALRRFHQVPMHRIRRAIEDLRSQFGDAHPLANKKMRVAGKNLLLDEVSSLLKLDGSGQLAIREVFDSYLKRVVHERQHAVRLFPWTSDPTPDAPMFVAIDPRVAFGKPFLRKSGAPTAAVMHRFTAKEPLADIAADLHETLEGVAQAVQLEQRRAA